MTALTPTAATAGALAPDIAHKFTRWRHHGDRQARDELIEGFLPLAHRLARRYVSSGEPYDDLVQIASLGLVKAVERFDPTRGFAFSTFAVPTIVGELKRYFRDAIWALHVDRGAKDRARLVADAKTQLSAQTGRSPTVSELAQYVECSEEEALEGLQTVAVAYDTLSLDAPPSAATESTARVELIGSDDERLERVDDTLSVYAAARRLPRREREILFLRFGADLPQTEIASRVGVSQMHVSRLLRGALARLRDDAEPVLSEVD